MKSNPKRAEHLDNFLTSTPRRTFKHGRSVGGPVKNPRLPPPGLIVQSKRFSTEHLPSKISPRNQPSRRRYDENPSPTSWAIICEHQIHHDEHSFDDYITGETLQLTPSDDDELLDGRHVIPDLILFRQFVDCASQTSSRHTQPFICADGLNFPESHPPTNDEHFIDIPSHSSSSLDRQPIVLSSGKAPIDLDKDDLSTNYDSDDGWSNDSAELIYMDEQYFTQKKKNISSFNSKEQR